MATAVSSEVSLLKISLPMDGSGQSSPQAKALHEVEGDDDALLKAKAFLKELLQLQDDVKIAYVRLSSSCYTACYSLIS